MVLRCCDNAEKGSWKDQVYSNVFGEHHSEWETRFVLIVGALAAYCSGLLNGVFVGEFVSPERDTSVAGYTGTYTKSGLALAEGDWDDFRFRSCLILSYGAGSFISGLMTPNPRPYRIEPTYGPSFFIAGIFIFVAAALDAWDRPPVIGNDDFVVAPSNHVDVVYYFAAAYSGIKNGIMSLFSNNLVRVSMTGATTDTCLALGQLFRGQTKKFWKGQIQALIIISFWLGAITAYPAGRAIQQKVLLLNVALCVTIGTILMLYLIIVAQISFWQAFFGRWDPGDAQLRPIEVYLEKQLRREEDRTATNIGGQDRMAAMLAAFDTIDKDKNGQIEMVELLDALLESDIKITAREATAIIKQADEDGDNMINRKEWEHLVKKMMVFTTTISQKANKKDDPYDHNFKEGYDRVDGQQEEEEVVVVDDKRGHHHEHGLEERHDHGLEEPHRKKHRHGKKHHHREKHHHTPTTPKTISIDP